MSSRLATKLTVDQTESWEQHGFFLVRGFEAEPTMSTMLERVIEIAQTAAAGEDIRPVFVLPEARPTPNGVNAEDLVSKVFRLHRDPTFAAFATNERLLGLLANLFGPDIDVFLSQFIFKNPGAMGQPWHQDSYYFPFEPDHQVGIWLAVTEASIENGCLHVLPGSHVEPVHEHVPDARPGANYGYVEIVDHDMTEATAVLMDPGDLLVFDSHLMHRSTDNVSDGIRAAMVYHYSPAGTVDHTPPRRSINDWVPVARATS